MKNLTNKKQKIIIISLAVAVVAIIAVLLIVLLGGKKNAKEAVPMKTLTVRTARLAEKDPVMSEREYTFLDGKLSKVKITDTYNQDETFKVASPNFLENTQKYKNVTANDEKRTIVYELQDISEWENAKFEDLKREYQEKLEWNIVVDKTTDETTEPETTTGK